MNNQQVTVMDISMTFTSMVWFMIKWAFASVIAAVAVGTMIGIPILMFMAIIMGTALHQ